MSFSHQGLARRVPHWGRDQSLIYLEEGFAGLTLVENDGSFTVGATLAFPAQTTPAWGDLGAYGAARTRAAGLVFLAALNLSTWEECGIAWHSTAAVVDPDSSNNTIQANATDGQLDNVTPIGIQSGLSTGTEYPLSIIARNLGAYLLNGTELLWMDAVGGDTTIYPMFANLDGAGELALWRVADLVDNNYQVFGTRDLDLCSPGSGAGTSFIAAPVPGNQIVHTADMVMTYDNPTAGGQVSFRRQDSTNRWQIFQNAGSYVLREIVVGTPVTRISGSLADGQKATVIANGTTISLYADDTFVGSYPSAETFISETDARIDAITGSITNWQAVTLDGVANVGSSNHPGYGLATNVLPGPRAAADTFTHEADCVLEFELPAIPTSGTLEFWFRADTVGTDGWRVTVDSAGNVDLDEVVSGSPTQRGTSAAAVSGGERLMISCVDETIKVYADNTPLITYSSAATQKTQTAGELEALGTGGWVSNITTYPYNFASAPNTGGASSAAAALALLGA